MFINRIASDKLEHLARSFPVIVITGARQTGKSTLLAHIFGQTAQTVVFDPVVDIAAARRDPDLFLDNKPTPLILDEIQYAPELVAAIKRRVDINPKPGQYLMTGSHRWGVLKNMAESLAGRAVFIDLEGFCAAELHAREGKPKPWLADWLNQSDHFIAQTFLAGNTGYTLHEQLWRGFLPAAQFLNSEAIPSLHAGYRQTYIERDVRIVAEISDLQQFGHFFMIAAALTAQEINYAHMGREIGISQQTAHRWLNILRETCQWFESPGYSGNAIKRVSGKSKGYIADTGIACSGQAVSSPLSLAGHPMLGALFETAVASDIRRQSASLSTPPNIYHWRSAGGAEVDILLERDGTFYPIEVKSSTRLSGHDTRGIEAFRTTYPKLKVAHGLVLAPIHESIRLSAHTTAIPWNPVVK